MAQALDTLSAARRRPADLARHLSECFSTACAQVLYDRNLLPGRAAFDLAVEALDAEHVAWWLSDPARINQLFDETFSARYRKRNANRTHDANWLSNLLRNWADHHPREFVVVAAAAAWPEVQRSVSPRDRFPYFLYDRALATGRVNIDEVRPGIERALNPLTIRQLVYLSGSVLSIAQAQGLALKQVRDVLLACSPAHAAVVQSLVRSSPMMSRAWAEYWKLPEQHRNTSHVVYPRVMQESQSFKIVSSSLVVDQLICGAPATVEYLAKDDMKNPSAFTRACLDAMTSDPRVLSAFTYKLQKENAPHILGRLAPHLAHVRCHSEQTRYGSDPKGVSYASMCLSRHPTLNMINALARQPSTVLQLHEPGPDGLTPYQEWVNRCIPGPSQRQQEIVNKNIAQGKRELLSGLVEPGVSDRTDRPRRTM